MNLTHSLLATFAATALLSGGTHAQATDLRAATAKLAPEMDQGYWPNLEVPTEVPHLLAISITNSTAATPEDYLAWVLTHGPASARIVYGHDSEAAIFEAKRVLQPPAGQGVQPGAAAPAPTVQHAAAPSVYRRLQFD